MYGQQKEVLNGNRQRKEDLVHQPSASIGHKQGIETWPNSWFFLSLNNFFTASRRERTDQKVGIGCE